MYTQKSITEIDNSEGPDVQHSSYPSMAKKKKKKIEILHPINTMPESGGCKSDNNHKIANRVYCTAASTRW